MSETDLIAVDAATVVTAGRATAGTADAWGTWASRCAYALTEVGTAVHNARIAVAASDYATRVSSAARQVGRGVARLGADAAAAGALIDDTDVEAASALSRPVNVSASNASPVNQQRIPV